MTAIVTGLHHLQLTREGQLRHFLTLDGLGCELLTDILDTADSFIEVGERTIKKVPLLRGRTVVNLFLNQYPHAQHLRAGGQTPVCRRTES